MVDISAKTTRNEILAYAIPEVPGLADAAPMTHVEALELVKENRMPTYVCSAATAPRYFVQVIFHDVAPGNDYVAGRPAPADQIWIRADIRGGRTDEQKSQIMRDVAKASGAAEDTVFVQLCDIPGANIAEYGRVMPPPGEEDAWFSSPPAALRKGSGHWPD